MLLESHVKDMPGDHPMHEAIRHLRKGIEDGRRVIRGVRPPVLDEPGLAGLLHELVEHFSTLGFKVTVECSPECDSWDVSDVIRTTLFRICQEALTNSWKHSGCTKGTVRIEKHVGFLQVEVDDEGAGIKADQDCWKRGFGLKGMEARAQLLGGSLIVESGESGTRIRAILPFAVGQS